MLHLQPLLLRRILWFSLCLVLSLVAGCARPRWVDSEVVSYSTLAAHSRPRLYRIERLPSQQAQPQEFAAIQAQAEQALARVGLQRNDAQAQLVVQIGFEGGTTLPRNWPYSASPHFGWGLGWSGRWHGGVGLGLGFGGLRDEPPLLYHRKVSLLMRDAATGQVVFESSALYEEVWTHDPMIYGVLFEQALRGFPQPPAGPRRERTEVLPQ